MTNLIILLISMNPSLQEATITYYAPSTNRVFVDFLREGEKTWTPGWANTLPDKGTNKFTLYAPNPAGLFRLRTVE